MSRTTGTASLPIVSPSLRSAAAVFPATHNGTETTIEETQAFIEAYVAARDRLFNRAQIDECWAARLWNRGL